MTLLLATDNAPQLDLRRITEHDADYVRLHDATVRRLRASVRMLVRELRRGEQGADTRFIHRHIDLMRDAYHAAHAEGQRDYWHAVSLKKPRIAQPDKHLVSRRLAWYALGSVLKMAREAQQAKMASGGHVTQSEGLDAQNRILARSAGILLADDPLAQWQASTDQRVALQGAIAWSGIQDGYLAGGVNDPATPFAFVYWELEPSAQHCADCPLMAAGSPYNAPGSGGNELDRTPGDGRTECGASCKCSLAYKPAVEREHIYLAQQWAKYWESTAAGGSGVDYQPSKIEQYKAYGRMPVLGRFNQQMADRLPNEPLIAPPQVPIEAAQKQALDNVRSARAAWDKVRADYPDLPEYPWYYSDNGGAHAVPLLYGQFYDYAEVAAALERLWDANAVWLSVNVAGDELPPETTDSEQQYAEWIALGGHPQGYSQNRDRFGRWAPGDGGEHASGGSGAHGRGGPVHEALTHARGNTGGGGGGNMSHENHQTYNREKQREKFGVDYHAHDIAEETRRGHTGASVPEWGKELATVSYNAERGTFRFSSPQTPEEEARGSSANYHRMRQAWASYDAHTGALVSHGENIGAHALEPSAEEYKAWGKEAQDLAAKWNGHLNDLTREDLFIRYGRIPAGEQSTNYVTGTKEAGVSVYRATYGIRSGMIEFDGSVRDPGTLYFLMGDRSPSLVTGREVGVGSDGEPIIKDVKVLGSLKYDASANAFGPEVSQ